MAEKTEKSFKDRLGDIVYDGLADEIKLRFGLYDDALCRRFTFRVVEDIMKNMKQYNVKTCMVEEKDGKYLGFKERF
jgi:hypothetical protein